MDALKNLLSNVVRGSYHGVEKRLVAFEKNWQAFHEPGQTHRIEWYFLWRELFNQIEQIKASVRTKVGHPFRVLKCKFGFTQVCYKGLIKITSQPKTLFAMSNLFMVKKCIIRAPNR